MVWDDQWSKTCYTNEVGKKISEDGNLFKPWEEACEGDSAAISKEPINPRD